MRIDLEYNNKSYYAQYSQFQLLSKKKPYKFKIGAYSGDAGDNISYHNGMYFGTFDKDNDNHFTQNCALNYQAWWYKQCHHSNLNSKGGSKDYSKGLNWTYLTGYTESDHLAR